jgi:hypothetical protein
LPLAAWPWHLLVGFAVFFSHPHLGRATPRADFSGRQGLIHRVRRAEPPPTLGRLVVAYAADREGKQVGDGECFSLAAQALTHAGARTAYAYGEVTPDADYVWGHPVGLGRLQPGDVLQFRNFRIVTRVTTLTQTADGVVSRSESVAVEERDHHTAIVEQAQGDTVVVLEQNVDPAGRVVQRNRIVLGNHVADQEDPAHAGRVLTEVSVEGDVRAYHPEAASAAELAEAAAAMPGDGAGGISSR